MLQKDRKGFYRQMLTLALPIALQNLLTSCAALVDTAMVAGLGNVTIAAVGVANRWTFLITLILFGFCSGSSVLIAQYWGAKETHSIHRTFGLAFACAGGFAILYILCASLFPEVLISLFTNEQPVIEAGAAYLRIVCKGAIFSAYSMMVMGARRSTEDVRMPMIATGTGVVVNTFLNYVLIYGHFGAPALGVRGAAYATFISVIVQAAIFFLMGWKQRHFTFASPRKLFCFRRDFTRKYIKVVAPVLLNESLWAVAFNIYAIIFARQGSENYAGYTVFGTIQDLAFVFFVGVCNACAIMIGKAVGRGGALQAYQMAKRYVMMTPVMGLVIGLALAAIRNPILGMMNIETETARMVASNLLLFYGLWLPVRMIPYTCVVGVFRAGGDTKTAFYLDVGVMYVFSIPVVAVLAYVVKIPFIPLVISMFMAEDIVKTVLCLLHFRSRRWICQLTRSGDNSQPESQP